MSRLIEFLSLYRMYRRTHSRRYAAWIAREIAFRGTPF